MCFARAALTPADDRAPRAVLAGRKVENKYVRVQLRVERAARVMLERRHQKSGRGLADRATFAATCPCGGALQMGCRRHDGGTLRLLDPRAFVGVRQRPQHRHGFRRAERHVPTRRVILNPAAKAGQRRARLRIDAVQRRFELGSDDGTVERKPRRPLPRPPPRRLTMAQIVVVAAKVTVVAECCLNTATGRD